MTVTPSKLLKVGWQKVNLLSLLWKGLVLNVPLKFITTCLILVRVLFTWVWCGAKFTTGYTSCNATTADVSTMYQRNVQTKISVQCVVNVRWTMMQRIVVRPNQKVRTVWGTKRMKRMITTHHLHTVQAWSEKKKVLHEKTEYLQVKNYEDIADFQKYKRSAIKCLLSTI